MLSSYKWQCKTFNELKNTDLYEILKLRSQIFVVEQNCVFLDMDGKDDFSYHFWATNFNNEIVAYTRLIPKNTVYEQMSIGRVVTAQRERNKGLGFELMKKSILECQKLFGEGSIKIGAQLYLKKFYESFGFVQSSEIYDEDGIDHLEMILN